MKSGQRRKAMGAAAVIFLATTAWAARQYVTVTQAGSLAGKPGEKVEVSIPFTILPGYHINSNKPTFDYMIATRMEWSDPALKHLGDTFPPAGQKTFAFTSGKKLAVYEGSQTIKSRFAIPAGAAPGNVTLAGKLRYQACDSQACYPPNSVDVKVALEIRK